MNRVAIKVGFSVLVGAITIAIPANLPVTNLVTLDFGPSGKIDASKPKISWQLATNGAEVSDYGMKIDGISVLPTFSKRQSQLEFASVSALPTGSHQVSAYVVLNGADRFEKNWEVEISPSARSSYPSPTPAQVQALAFVNDLRTSIELSPLEMDSSLNYASESHSDYLALNGKSGHIQTPGDDLFFGETMKERLARVGYVGAGCETVTQNAKRLCPSIKATFDAPYHRIAFMNPEPGIFGAGYSGKQLTMTFQAGSHEGIALSPAPNQKHVPINWVDREIPSPLAGTGLTDVGYPIVAHFAGLNRGEIASVKATIVGMTGDQLLVKTPLNDPNLVRSVILIPKLRLASDTAYTVNVEVTKRSGETVSREWTFTTEPKL